MHEHVRDGDIAPKNGGLTYEALVAESYVPPPAFKVVERAQLQRARRRLPMAPAGIMRMRGKR